MAFNIFLPGQVFQKKKAVHYYALKDYSGANNRLEPLGVLFLLGNYSNLYLVLTEKMAKTRISSLLFARNQNQLVYEIR